MPFDYLESNVSERFEEVLRPHARDAHVRALRDRAAMLARFGYSREDVVRRLEQNVEWDYDLWAKRMPDFYAEIPRIVEEVFQKVRR